MAADDRVQVGAQLCRATAQVRKASSGSMLHRDSAGSLNGPCSRKDGEVGVRYGQLMLEEAGTGIARSPSDCLAREHGVARRSELPDGDGSSAMESADSCFDDAADEKIALEPSEFAPRGTGGVLASVRGLTEEEGLELVRSQEAVGVEALQQLAVTFSELGSETTPDRSTDAAWRLVTGPGIGRPAWCRARRRHFRGHYWRCRGVDRRRCWVAARGGRSVGRSQDFR